MGLLSFDRPASNHPLHKVRKRRGGFDGTEHVGYIAATRHPWPCLLFLLPLLIAYECGVFWVGGTQAETLRNGADTWLRWGLEAFGLRQLYAAPVLVVAVFLIQSVVRRHDPPRDMAGVCLGMAIESVVFAVALWGLSRSVGSFMNQIEATEAAPAQSVEGVAHVVTFVGAGIYEEVLFRLVLFSGVALALRAIRVPRVLAVPVAALVSAIIFSAAHHVGPYGEPFDDYVFAFRTLAGLYFAMLYQFRGFGIAVGAHACYDVLVGTGVG
jgi:membrane protease YdiL (CAAX protease family)